MNDILGNLVAQWGAVGLAIALLIYDNLDKRKELRESRARERLMAERTIILGETTQQTQRAETQLLAEIKTCSERTLSLIERAFVPPAGGQR